MSAHDFNELFDEWAPRYDLEVYDPTSEYHEVFADYDTILDTIVTRIPAEFTSVMEIGVGTGNLAKRLADHQLQVIGIEPSEGMRLETKKKGFPIDLREGNFLEISLTAEEQVDVVVSAYAFHHLTTEEKQRSVQLMKAHLRPNGMIIFADTSFANEAARQEIVDSVVAGGKENVLRDLETEFFEYVPVLTKIFMQEGFEVTWEQMNRYVWLLEAKLGL